MRIESIEVTAPEHWASYLINGDATSFDYYNDDDEQQCYNMENELSKQGYYVVDCVEHGFTHYPDYGQAGDCCLYTFIRNIKEL